MNGTYVLQPSGVTQFHWALKAGNSETILSSQLYASKQGAETGIESCRNNCAVDASYGRLVSKDLKPYFVVRAGNGETIGTSQMYASETSRDSGIASCKQYGRSGVTRDETGARA
jgi:uncharacterized protein YegP (UPF0339 family)